MSGPGLKPLPINASFFPEGVEGAHVEDAGGSSRPKPSKTHSRGPSRAPSAAGVSSEGDVSEKDENKDKIILVVFEENDPEDPMNWSNTQKWIITILLDLMTTIIGLSTSAYSNTITGMAKEFGVAEVVCQVGMFTFNASCAVAPLFFAPLCEFIGRREVFLSAFAGFVTIFLMLALGQNVETEIIGRFFSGIFGSCGTILVGGTLADIWKTHERSVPMSSFTFVAIFGTIAAPLYCGYIDVALGWRWIEWIHMIASGALLVLEVFLLKETRGAKILDRRAKKLRETTGDRRYRSALELETESVRDLLQQSCTRAVKLLLAEPVLFFFGFWIAFAWGITFLFLSVIPLTFEGNHHWSEGRAGLPYIALILGCVIGFVTDFWATAKYDRVTRENGGLAVPEYRLWGAMHFAVALPIGLFIFSFTQYAFVHWIAPCIALVLIILGIYHIFLAVYNYTADSYGEISSSGIAGQGLMRNMFAASFPLFSTQMFKGMGYQYAGLLLALISSLMVPLPYILFKYGAAIRKKSKYAAANTGAIPEEREPTGKEVADSAGEV